jgi:hypothetical protein
MACGAELEEINVDVGDLVRQGLPMAPIGGSQRLRQPTRQLLQGRAGDEAFPADGIANHCTP